MKTATINVYHVFGTKNQTSVDIRYRGKLLRYFSGIENPQTLLDKARDWAHANGFSHTKIIYG